MRILKIILSVVALLIGATGTAMTGGLFNVSPQVVGIVLALGGLISVLGISPFPIGATTARVFSAVAVLLGTVQAAHASSVTAAANPHPWVWAIVGVASVLIGVMGKSPIPHPVAPPASAPVATP